MFASAFPSTVHVVGVFIYATLSYAKQKSDDDNDDDCNVSDIIITKNIIHIFRGPVDPAL